MTEEWTSASMSTTEVRDELVSMGVNGDLIRFALHHSTLHTLYDWVMEDIESLFED